MCKLKKSSVCFSLILTVAIAASGCGGAASAPPLAASVPPASAPPASSPAPPPAPSPAPSSAPSSGDLNIAAPSNGSSVASPFTLNASATVCSSQTVASIAYSLDGNGSASAQGTSLVATVAAAAGTHTLQVTARGEAGATCTASVAVTVTLPAPPVVPLVPANAVTVNAIQTLNAWQAAHDPASGSTSSGATQLVDSPSRSGTSREFDTSFTGSGGERYFVTVGSDQAAHDFFYDGWVYLTSSASTIANLEMDMNQVIPNGDTIIYGFQCDGYSGTWDYTENSGTAAKPSDHWVHSQAGCNVRNWKQGVWHHLQIGYSRDDTGHVTYHSVWFDGAENPINATVYSEFSLGWSSVLLTNLQVDGLNSGSNTIYLDQLAISRW
jgi:hypothetical protein